MFNLFPQTDLKFHFCQNSSVSKFVKLSFQGSSHEAKAFAVMNDFLSLLWCQGQSLVDREHLSHISFSHKPSKCAADTDSECSELPPIHQPQVTNSCRMFLAKDLISELYDPLTQLCKEMYLWKVMKLTLKAAWFIFWDLMCYVTQPPQALVHCMNAAFLYALKYICLKM